MKKSHLLAAALTCAVLAPATLASPDAPARPGKAAATKAAPGKAKKKISEQEAAVIREFTSLQDAAIATFMELSGTLSRVKDRESADEAAPTVKLAGEQLCTIIGAVEALGAPSEAAQQAIMSRMANVAEKNRITEEVMLPLLELMMQEPPCYGSEALQTELSNLLANLQGAAGLNEEEVEEAGEAASLKEPDADEPTE